MGANTESLDFILDFLDGCRVEGRYSYYERLRQYFIYGYRLTGNKHVITREHVAFNTSITLWEVGKISNKEVVSPFFTTHIRDVLDENDVLSRDKFNFEALRYYWGGEGIWVSLFPPSII